MAATPEASSPPVLRASVSSPVLSAGPLSRQRSVSTGGSGSASSAASEPIVRRRSHPSASARGSNNLIARQQVYQRAVLAAQRPKPILLEERHNYSSFTVADDDARATTDTERSDNRRRGEWRLRSNRCRTVSVALVMCLNIGCEPPDVLKTKPCAKLECWIDPGSLPPQKALQTIGNRLQSQYEYLHPRAKFVQSLDQSYDDIRKLCVSLRRASRGDRVLFHYCGHGVPRPTENGEIWCFNRNYTQYLPLSIYDLQTWMGSPSFYVFDCNNAGSIIDHYVEFAETRERSLGAVRAASTASVGHSPAIQVSSPSLLSDCILMGACAASEMLPMNPEYPADIFTSCLTTPIKMALRWFAANSPLSTLASGDLLDSIPGSRTDRTTPLGEIMWIFTTVTDTIAWNVLHSRLFQQLFRQDLLAASLFRNFLLAERVLRSVNCTPVSVPALPNTHKHPMWQSWDLAAEFFLAQLEKFSHNPSYTFKPSHFFTEQLTAFEVWLDFCQGVEAEKPLQLPVVLQLLLSKVHRLRSLQLLSRFVDKGTWAVGQALSVGIFPYVLKLLHSPTVELREVLVSIWSKILAYDRKCQVELAKDKHHSYFVAHLASSSINWVQRLQASFIIAAICDGYRPGQVAVLRSDAFPLLVAHLHSNAHFRVRQFMALCIAKLWENCEDAKQVGVRLGIPERLVPLAVSDNVPEVRAAATYALGKLMGVNQHMPERQLLELQLAKQLSALVVDGSPMVRRELVMALCDLVFHQSDAFAKLQLLTSASKNRKTSPGARSAFSSSPSLSISPAEQLEQPQLSQRDLQQRRQDDEARELMIYVWKVVLACCRDPYPGVNKIALALRKYVAGIALVYKSQGTTDMTNLLRADGSATNPTDPTWTIAPSTYCMWSFEFFKSPMLASNGAMFECTATLTSNEIADLDWRHKRNTKIIEQATAMEVNYVDHELAHQVAIFQTSFEETTLVMFHQYEPLLVAADSNYIGIWNYASGDAVNVYHNENMQLSHITSLMFLNESQESLLAVGSDDGIVRVWKNCHCPDEQRLLTAFVAIPHMKRGNPGLIADWQPDRDRVLTTGNAEVVRIWDISKEMSILDVPVGTDSCVTTMCSEGNGDVVYIGCGDHTLRRFDLRVAHHPVESMYEHLGWVVHVHKQRGAANGMLISGSIRGDVTLWDTRYPRRAVEEFSVHSGGRDPLNTLSIHDYASVIATGSQNQFVKVLNTTGKTLNTIRYHDGFLGQRIGPVHSLAFHPHQLLLASGCRDRYISIFKLSS